MTVAAARFGSISAATAAAPLPEWACSKIVSGHADGWRSGPTRVTRPAPARHAPRQASSAAPA